MSIACIIISNDTPCTQNYVPISYEQVSYRKRKNEKKKKIGKKERKIWRKLLHSIFSRPESLMYFHVVP